MPVSRVYKICGAAHWCSNKDCYHWSKHELRQDCFYENCIRLLKEVNVRGLPADTNLTKYSCKCRDELVEVF